MIDVSPVTLDGTHVRLEPLTRGHHAALASVLDPTLLQWFPTPATNADELKAWMEEALAEAAAGRGLPFATVERASGKVVGSTRFLAIERTHRSVEIGATWIARPWQRSAINTEAKLVMLAHAFEAWRCIRVEFKTDSLNTQSRAALTRLGATEEGTFRNHRITTSGRLRHSVYYSVIESEWPALKAKLQARLAAGPAA